MDVIMGMVGPCIFFQRWHGLVNIFCDHWRQIYVVHAAELSGEPGCPPGASSRSPVITRWIHKQACGSAESRDVVKSSMLPNEIKVLK